MVELVTEGFSPLRKALVPKAASFPPPLPGKDFVAERAPWNMATCFVALRHQ